jgi:hypothetical protein
LGDISAEDEAEVMETYTQFQRADLANFARHVPCGLLIEKGAPGTGKTTALNKLVELQWRQGKKVGCYAPTNSAVNNFMGRALQNSKDPDGRLFIRMRSRNTEYRAISSQFSPESMEGGPQQNRYKARLGYQWEGSMGAAVCQLAGVEPMNNRIINGIRLKNDHTTLGDLLRMRKSDRKSKDKSQLKRLVSEAAAELVKAADGVFMTLTQAGSAWGRAVINAAEVCAVDEVAAALEVEILPA